MSDESVGAQDGAVGAVRRHPMRTALIAAAVVLVAVVGIVLLVGGDDGDGGDDDTTSDTSEVGGDSTTSDPSPSSSTIARSTTTAGPSTSTGPTTTVAGARTYEVSGLPTPTCRVGEALVQGSAGPDVECLQARLNAAMTSGEDLTVDGSFGAETERAVREFQTSASLVVDGIVGPQTLEALGIAEVATTTTIAGGSTSTTRPVATTATTTTDPGT